MFDSKSTKMNKALEIVVNQLKVESTYLDTVIESSLEMQSILRERRSDLSISKTRSANANRQPVEPADSDPAQEVSPAVGLRAEHNQRLNDRMKKLQTDIQTNFAPVLEGRKQMILALKSTDSTAEKTPTLSELANQVDEPIKSQLKQLRSEIRDKLNHVHSISMGNQAVLLYTLDFYNRLLSGLSGDSQRSSYYNASGQSQTHNSSSIVQTKC